MAPRTPARWNAIVCDAIERRVRLAFDYDGKSRVAEPYCHGLGTAGVESLRAVQVRGDGSALGSGKLWHVAKIRGLRATDEPFDPSDPHYNPNDSAFTAIHCRI